MFTHENKKKSSNEANDTEGNMITVNNFFPHSITQISVTEYGSDKELIRTFSPYEIYQYSDAMLKYLPKDSLKELEKHCFTAKKVSIITVRQ